MFLSVGIVAVAAQRYLTAEEMENDPYHNRGFTIKSDTMCGQAAYISLDHQGELGGQSNAGHCEDFRIMIADYDETLPEGSGGPYTYSIQGSCGENLYLGVDSEGEVELGHNRFPDHCQTFHIRDTPEDGYISFESVCSGEFLALSQAEVFTGQPVDKCVNCMCGIFQL